MYKIAHISDLHISYKDENENGKKLVELLRIINEKDCDHLLITGDLVENPVEQDLHYVNEILLKFGYDDPSKISIVPGNHDIFGGAYKGLGSILFPKRCKDTDYEKNMNQFCNVFNKSFPDELSFPYLKIINNTAVIALNTVMQWSAEENPEGSNGIVLTEDFLKLKKFFKCGSLKDKFVFVLLHHHLNVPEENDIFPAHSLWLKTIDWKMKLHNRKAFLKCSKEIKTNLIFHGHTHVNEVYVERKIPVVNSSACSLPLTDDGIRSFNIVSVPDIAKINENGPAENNFLLERIII